MVDCDLYNKLIKYTKIIFGMFLLIMFVIKCYRGCPSECVSCTADSRDRGYPCTRCPDGYYDFDCKQTCPNNCVTCFIYNGGYPCITCIAGKYGTEDCSASCSFGCDVSTCNIDGSCTCRYGFSGDKCCLNNPNCETCSSSSRCSVCKTGYSGDKCCLQNSFCERCSSNTECAKCIDGRYGNECEDACPDNCEQQSCYRDGSCVSCKTGYTGSICEACIDGYFIESRSDMSCIKCSNLCENGICEALTGYCPDGCTDRYWGVACLNSCPIDCLICQRETGICEVCDNGKYKPGCSHDCNAECDSNAKGKRLCKIENGHCFIGCRTKTIYGPLCQQLCSKNCNNNECNWETGHCYECAENKYGATCEFSCGSYCLREGEKQFHCFKSNGTCIHGCIIGYYGDTCGIECSPNCKTPRCSRNTGQCLDGCLEGFEGAETYCVKAISQNVEDVGNLRGQVAVIGGSVGCGVAVIVLVVILVICVITRRHRANIRSGDTRTKSGDQQISAIDLSGPSTSEVQPAPEYEEFDEIPTHRNECDQVVIDTITTDNYDNLDRQHEDAGQYDIIEEANKT